MWTTLWSPSTSTTVSSTSFCFTGRLERRLTTPPSVVTCFLHRISSDVAGSTAEEGNCFAHEWVVGQARSEALAVARERSVTFDPRAFDCSKPCVPEVELGCSQWFGSSRRTLAGTGTFDATGSSNDGLKPEHWSRCWVTHCICMHTMQESTCEKCKQCKPRSRAWTRKRPFKM